MITMVPKTPGEFLKRRQRTLRDGFEEDFGVRIHRAISWVMRAENETEDPDARFIFLWIAFNAAYSTYDSPSDSSDNEQRRLGRFLKTITEADKDNRLYEVIWDNFPAQIRNLLNNKHVFAPFWHFQNGVAGYEDWAHKFDIGRRSAAKALGDFKTREVLSQIFSRLYVLRNQLVHGGATWAGQVNRAQVKDGADIMFLLVPTIIDLMLDNPSRDWGTIYYKVIE